MSGFGRRPLVSVIVPMFQSAATIGETVRSVLADFDASEIDGELLVVNDGSSDRGPRIVEAMACGDDRITLINKPNGGLSSARNAGINASGSRFLRFLDADDLALPGGLARLVVAASPTGASCGGQTLIDASGAPMGREISPRCAPDRTVSLDQLRSGNAIGVGAVLIARALLADRRFDESLPVCEDWDLWLRLASAGARFAALPAWMPPVKAYRVRAGSLSKKFTLMHDVGARVLRSIEPFAGRIEPGLQGLALGYGAMHALSGDLESGLALLRQHPAPTTPVSAPDLAADAFAAVLLGLGQLPERPDVCDWISRVQPWWKSLVELAWTTSDHADAAWDHLAHRTLLPADIARECCIRARNCGASRVVVLGAGKNGRAVMDAIGSLPATMRDDAVAPTDAQNLPISVENPSMPLPPDSAVIVTPLNDRSLLQRLPPLPPDHLIRWSQVQADLAQAERRRLTQNASPALSTSANKPSLRCA